MRHDMGATSGFRSSLATSGGTCVSLSNGSCVPDGVDEGGEGGAVHVRGGSGASGPAAAVAAQRMQQQGHRTGDQQQQQQQQQQVPQPRQDEDVMLIDQPGQLDRDGDCLLLEGLDPPGPFGGGGPGGGTGAGLLLQPGEMLSGSDQPRPAPAVPVPMPLGAALLGSGTAQPS
jgi:hypothetical protein